jgi:cell wall-associated NlpC family hydrolase
VAVAGAESRHNPEALSPPNTNGTRDHGMWQINDVHRSQPFWTDNWQDPYENARMAYAIWQAAGNSWKPWTTYNSGSYRSFLSEQPTAPEVERVTPETPQLEDGTPACSLPDDAAPPGSFTAGGVRTVTDPTSKITYRIPVPSGPAGVAVNFALDQVGEPYVFGSQGPDSWDCSGLVSKAWAAAGETVYPQTETLVRQEPKITGVKKPGDLLYKPGHVQMFLMSLPSGKDLVVEAPRTGLDVRVVAQWMTVTQVLRPDAGRT